MKQRGTARGFRWADSNFTNTVFHTILPPNAPLCTSHANEGSVMTASSRHQGGAHVLMGDGAVVFITDSIEAGDGRQPVVTRRAWATLKGSKSPFGLWGALGTRASKETVEEQLNQ